MKSIIMQPEDVVKTLKGIKTNTRRVIVPQPEFGVGWFKEDGSNVKDFVYRDEDGDPADDLKPRYHIGDLVYCKEPWCPTACGPLMIHTLIAYKTGDFKSVDGYKDGTIVYNTDKPNVWKWRSPIFMPEKYSRCTIRITDIKAELVQDISEEDAKKEGFCVTTIQGYGIGSRMYVSATINFSKHWDSNNAKRGFPFSLNPWEFAYTYEVVK